MVLTRREMIGLSLGAAAGMAINPRLLSASILPQGSLIKRAIPKTGEMVPVIGLGSSATFSSVARSEDKTALKDVLKVMVERGATVFDTAPSYGASEQVAGEIAAELGLTDKIFWATKVNVAGGRGATSPAADPARARQQIATSFDRLKKAKIDCIQVHNLGDIPTQMGILKELKADGKVRYIGTTSTSDGQYDQLAQVMRSEPLDFIGVDYAIDNRNADQMILPLAQERGIGVLVYVPFGRTSLFRRTAGVALPDFAKEIDATTWAQFFLKWILGNPAVTVVTPATSQAKNMIDNIGGGIGRLPDAALRKRMSDFIDALPPAPSGRGGGF
jgi:aryl-alcohol dehydrogenase-like predicted oxidoreductase